MDINQIVQELDEQTAKSALSYFLTHYLTPAFGTLPKIEVELLTLKLLEQINAIDSAPEVYELVSKLKVTRSKARRLIYDLELRNSSEADLDLKVQTLLKKPLIQKDGDLFVFEVENPLVSDHFRARVQKLGYVTDGSFSPSIIKLSLEAATALIASFLSPAEQEQMRKALIKAGAADASFTGVLKAVLKKLASRVASETGEALMEKVSDFITPVVEASVELVLDKARLLFSQTASKP